MPRSPIVYLTAAATLLLSTPPAMCVTPAEKCEANKLKTAGKYAFCRLKADAKAIKSSSTAEYSKCDEKYGSKWATVESKAAGACPVSGDAAAVQSQVTACTNQLAVAIGGDPPAPSCGNGAVDPGEDCDLGIALGATCVSDGFAGGTLACGSGCTFDVSGCWNVRFVDNGDGTITDNLTGLMWEKKFGLDGVFADGHDADFILPWAGLCTGFPTKRCQPGATEAALCAAGVDGHATACAECTGGEGLCSTLTTVWTFLATINSASFAGYTDWRVPTRQELETILDYGDATPPAVSASFHGASCGGACTDITDPACSCTNFITNSGAVGYWSASRYAQNFPPRAWTIGFADGDLEPTIVPQTGYVRAVRGAS